MKKMILASMVLSTLSYATFAKDSAGIVTSGSVGKSTLITISGAPAKKIFSSLAMKGDFKRLNSETVGTLKSSPEISCLNVTGVDAFQCKILIAANGNALAIKDFSITTATPKAGTIDAGGMIDYTNVTIGGQAAQLLMKSLTEAKATSTRQGSLITSVRMGGSVTCTSSAEVALVTNCRLSVTSNGNVEANFAR